jgi:pimeloyl-ACP methyl ester carboxylesterase
VTTGALAGYVLAQQAWAFWQLASKDVQAQLAVPLDPGDDAELDRAYRGTTFSETKRTATYIRVHTIENGIERIVYIPRKRRFDTPIIMQHGMWHGAWCWEHWQELFAVWGWETHAHSLPGHAGSALRRPIARCTLDYYLRFLKAEIDRLSDQGVTRRPVLMGHSMGGALTQWYLKYVDNERAARGSLSAAVLVAPWVSHSMVKDGLMPMITYDPLGVLMMLLTWDATPMKRDAPRSAVRFLVGPQAAVSLEDLQPKLGPESAIVMYQHNPPFWYPPTQVKPPLLWVAGEDDPLLTEPAQRRSAAYYKADYIVAEQARHNVMMEHNYRETAKRIHNWLIRQQVL